MKWCVEFPEETILIVRPSLKRICLDNKPASTLLSVLLYRSSIRIEANEDAVNLNELNKAQGKEANQDTTTNIYRNQAQIIQDCCGEMTTKTLHDTAIPTLEYMGYIEVEEKIGGHDRYLVHLDRVRAGLNAYKKGTLALREFYKTMPQLETFLIVKTGVSLERILIDKKSFQSTLETFLNNKRKVSNVARGRKPKGEHVSYGKNKYRRLDKTTKENIEEGEGESVTSTEEESAPVVSNSPTGETSNIPPSTTSNIPASSHSQAISDIPTDNDIPETRIYQVQTSTVDTGWNMPRQTAVGRNKKPSSGRKPNITPLPAAAPLPVLTLEGELIFAHLEAALDGIELSRENADEINAANRIGKRRGVTREVIEDMVLAASSDGWRAKHGKGVSLKFLDDKWNDLATAPKVRKLATTRTELSPEESERNNGYKRSEKEAWFQSIGAV